MRCACWNMYRLAEKVGQGKVGGFTHRVKSTLVLMVGITAAEYMGRFCINKLRKDSLYVSEGVQLWW